MTERAMLSYYSTDKITQLNGAINDSVTSITLDSSEGIRVGQVLLFDDGSNSEQVTVSSITSATVIVVTRNASPQAHDDDAAVSHAPVWNNVYVRGSSSISAIISLEIIDVERVPTVANIVLDNQSADPYAATAALAKGNVTDLFDNFLPVRIIDPESGFILFNGLVYDADEKHEGNFGMTLHLECKDALEEVRNAPTDGAPGIQINTSVAIGTSLSNTTAAGVLLFGRKLFSKAISSRGGVIRSLLNIFSDNVVSHGTADSISGTFAEAVDDSETAIDVTSAANLCVGNVIYSSTEDMLITGISSNTLTVTREVNSTSAIEHDNGASYSVRDSRYTESVKKFNRASGVFELDTQNQKSALSHIADMSAIEPQQSTALNAAGEKFYGYSYYLEPNFTSSLTSHKPSGQFFNYFPRSTRPSTTPLTYGLRVEQPSSGGFTPTGQLLPMISSDFDRAKNELFTDAIIKYSATRVDDKGAQVTNEYNLPFEILTVKAVANAGSFIWQGRTLHGGTDRTLLDPTANTTYNPEILQAKVLQTNLNMAGGCDASETKLIFDNGAGMGVGTYIQLDNEIMQVDATNPDGDNANEMTVDRAELGTSGAEHDDNADTYHWIDIATMQYINKTSAVSDGSPAYVLISAPENSFNVHQGHGGVGSLNTSTKAYFAEDEVLRGKTNPTSTFTIKSRPRNKFGTRKILRITAGSNASDSDSLRETIASSLIRATNDIVRGTVTTYEKPFFHIDNNVGAVASSGGVDTITTSNDTINSTSAALILSNYGFRTGMLVNELTAAGGTPTGTYGYAVNAGTTQLQVSNWFDGGSISASSELRYYIPVRAGDLIYLKNNLSNIAGNYDVVKVHYAEQNGVSQTTYEVVSSGSDKGGGAKVPALSATSDAATTTVNIANKASGPISAAFGAMRISTNTDGSPGLLFTSTSATQVAWTGGSLVAGTTSTGISPNNTGATMITAGNGNTGQATDGTAALIATAVDYFIYWDMGDTVAASTELKTIRAAAYSNVATQDTVLIALVRNNTSQGDCDITVFPDQSSIATKGRADYKLSDPGIMTSLVAGSSFNENLDQLLIWHDSAKQWKWVTPQGFDGTYQKRAMKGTVSAPAYSFVDDTDTGMYIHNDGGHLMFAVNGSLKFDHDGTTFTIAGALAKTSGTFLIDHPVHEDKKLQHGFIEGPKYDLLYRGRATLRYGKATVDINIASNMSAGTFEALTQDPEVWVQNITGWTAVKGSVSGATLTIEAATNSSDTVAWLVMAERADSDILESETTDAQGHLIPESEKPPEKEEKN